MLLCPFDSTELKVVNRSGIEIDWCPACKGVWLERGELDKLIDQVAGSGAPVASSPEPGFVPPAPAPAASAPGYATPAPPPGPAPQPAYPPQPGYPPQPVYQQQPMSGYGHPGDYRPPRRGSSSDSWDDRYRGGGYPRKRKHLLKEIFDF